MIRVGPLSRARVRAACLALRVRWVEELERQRDDARAAKDLALSQVAQVREAFEISQRARVKEREVTYRLDEAIEDARKALRAAGYELGDEVDIGRDVDRALNQSSSDGAAETKCACGHPRHPDDAGCLACGATHPREAYDPAMGGDIEPPPGRTYPPGTGPRRPGHRPVEQRAVVEATIGCGMLADGVDCGGEDGHVGGCWPDPRALAREALVKHDIVHGVVAAAAALVLDEEHLLTDRGMTIDGDVLTEVIGEGLPDEWTDQSCRATADRILDAAVRAGMTVMQGPELTPRQVAEVPF